MGLKEVKGPCNSTDKGDVAALVELTSALFA